MSTEIAKKPGRKRIKVDLEKVEELASRGLGPVQIARALGVSWSTIDRNRKRSAEFEDTLKRGKARGLATVTNSLFENALGGNVTAQIFYLKNTDPETWSDRQQVDHQIDLSKMITNAQTRLSVKSASNAPIKMMGEAHTINTEPLITEQRNHKNKKVASSSSPSKRKEQLEGGD